ncbi:MAG: hypothetical protein SFW35_03305 [Chitinophagales bacterium]|nr:hypothetical protein [Chitinophagales bacterium]
MCFWKSKSKGSEYDSERLREEKLYETDEWYFGYGYRGRWGFLEKELEEFEEYAPYPLQFDEEMLSLFNGQMLEIINSASDKVYHYHILSDLSDRRDLHDKFDLVQTYLEINKEAEFGHDKDKGFWMKRLKHIEPLIDTRYRGG